MVLVVEERRKKENAQRRRAAVVEGEPRERPHFILPLWGGEGEKKRKKTPMSASSR